MSIFELLVVIIVALFVLKPEDLSKILNVLKNIKAYISDFKKQLNSYINYSLIDDSQSKEIKDEVNQINFFIEKIIEIEGEYKGDYSLASVKEKYNELIKDKINKQINNELSKNS